MSAVCESPGDLVVAACLNLVQDRIAHLHGDAVLQGEICDALGSEV